ncbi:hypothetical protein [Hymenobacter negativus]|uniref:Glycosyltransferase RgtA/B/C/D-like domain-containing protein n=1 Tax=Hymenobacter negativus TaxID=2795026 RepID=A0ABS0Q355_9BACT|nr:hypothetical protein [Hymenobacter negativus]MBH8557091.1 hypothetical protein [Hymenobacter negativus]
MLALCAGYAALVMHSSSWTEARQLDAIFPFYKWRIRIFSADEYSRARQLLAGVAVLFGLLAGTWINSSRGRIEGRQLMRELRSVIAGLRRAFAALPTAQRRGAALLLLALTAFRFLISLPAVTPGYDDVPSYEMFASKSLLAVSAYYPVPNNHVLSNTISWVFYHLTPGFWFTMRLPVILAATVATMLLFLGLLWARASFRVAWLSTLLFSLAQLSLYHVAVGRGYWLLTLMAVVAFFASLALVNGTRQPRAAWTGLMVGGVLGLYTVPTFALVLGSAFSWLGFSCLRQRSWTRIAVLAVSGAVVVTGSLLLYSPLLFVSGPAIFFGNGFVAPKTFGTFWRGLPAYLWETEGFLAGQAKIGGLLVLVVLAAVLLLRRRVPQWPTAQQQLWRRLVPAAIWFMAFPYAMMAVQRVFAPGRAVLYKAFFFFLLLALVIDWLLQVTPKAWQQWLRPALSVVAVLWFSYEINSLWRDNQRPRRRNEALYQAFLWLDQHPKAPTLIPESTHSLFVRMYLHSERPGQLWLIDHFPQPGISYTYVLAFPDLHGWFQPRFAFPPVFHNEQVDIYRLNPAVADSASAAGALPSYWHLAE